MRFEATTGIFTASLMRRAAQAKPARGTACAMVGMRASCQPMPVLRIVAPACSMACASCTVSAPREAAFDQVERGDAEHDDEIRPGRGARLAHDLAGEAHAVLERAAPVVLALVGAQREELRDQVALRAHDLDAVVAGGLREHRGAHEVADGLLDLRPRPARAARSGLMPDLIGEGATMFWWKP